MISLSLLPCLLLAAPLAEGRAHLDHGRYDEAIGSFTAAESEGADPAAIALGVSRAMIETGRYDEAAARLEHALKQAPKNADLLARRGELRLLRGDFAGSMADAEAALQHAPEHPRARWVKAESLVETGRIAEALEECRWFVRFYNRAQPTDADTLVTVAKGSLRYARWKRVSSIFHFVINDLCPDIAKVAPEDWRADAISGIVLLEKYNEAQGKPDLERALAKNPNAAEVHVTLARAAIEDYEFETAAERITAALKANPRYVPALVLEADLALAKGNSAAAGRSLDSALAVNPHDQETLARIAAREVLAGRVDRDVFAKSLAAFEKGDSTGIDASTEFDCLLVDLLERNPRPGAFLNRLGARLEGQRRYAEAEAAYATAIKVMPEASDPQVSLGLLAMRAGDLSRAKAILDAAFKADPFHVRVSNMRKVVGLLESYETIETPHFVIRFDPAKDRVLGELTAEYLEAAFPELTAEFGFEPPGRTVVELFHKGRGQTGHEWFSARMVGLPWLQTIGASTGLMIAIASPTSGQEYNWARVVRHEFAHVVTLQQTDFRVPTWYTEALAVRSEGYPRPQEWDDLLRKRVPEEKLRTLDELNAAFVSPKTSDDRQFAYCQSLLYADYLDAKIGGDIHRRLLDAYARGLETDSAITKATGISVAEFDAGYREYLRTIVGTLGAAADEPITDDVQKLLDEALSAARRKRTAEAIGMLEAGLDRADPQPAVLESLGKLKLLDGDPTAAAEFFTLGREKFPQDRKWLKLHAAALLTSGDDAALKPLLERIADIDADDASAPKKLSELAAESGDHAAAKRWAFRAIYVAPNDASLHRLLATACEGLGEIDRATTATRHAEWLESAADVDDDGE